MNGELQMWRDKLKRAEGRMGKARSDTEYENSRDMAQDAARQVENITYIINR